LWTTTIVVCTIVGLSIFAQVTTMAKQAAAPPSPPESVVLSEAEAATTSTAGAPGAVAASTGGATNANGAKVFAANCASCHGAQGQGTPGAFPPLANNPVVTGDPQKVIGILTAGLHGQISVGGMSYNGQMPAWKGQLSNKDIADVITYIRGGLGSNHASAVTEAQVAGYKP
jgi:cbb3-type cytochrome c oxidase subunit III